MSFIFPAITTVKNSHQLQISYIPFDAITSGAETNESQLYDEKRQTIEIGDAIVFTNREATDQTISVKVIGKITINDEYRVRRR